MVRAHIQCNSMTSLWSMANVFHIRLSLFLKQLDMNEEDILRITAELLLRRSFILETGLMWNTLAILHKLVILLHCIWALTIYYKWVCANKVFIYLFIFNRSTRKTRGMRSILLNFSFIHMKYIYDNIINWCIIYIMYFTSDYLYFWNNLIWMKRTF
jgi:hypothetical protein